jgi:hypothetical protein
MYLLPSFTTRIAVYVNIKIKITVIVVREANEFEKYLEVFSTV